MASIKVRLGFIKFPCGSAFVFVGDPLNIYRQFTNQPHATETDLALEVFKRRVVLRCNDVAGTADDCTLPVGDLA